VHAGSYAAEHCSQLKGEDTKYAWRGESVLCMRACLSHVLIKAPLAAYGIAYSMAAVSHKLAAIYAFGALRRLYACRRMTLQSVTVPLDVLF